MCSYKVKKTKNMYVLSSMHNAERDDDEDPKRRNEVILIYNETKVGVDPADEMLSGYSAKATNFYKKELIYYVDIMLIKQVTECQNFVHKPRQIFFFFFK